MMSRYELLLWRDPSMEEVPIDDVAAELVRLVKTFQDVFPEFRPLYLYISGNGAHDTYEFVDDKGFIADALSRNEPDRSMAKKKGYTTSVFTEGDLESISISMNLGCTSKMLRDSIVINFPFTWPHCDEAPLSKLKRLFCNLAMQFHPYWGCVTESELTREKSYMEGDVPQYLHWLNFLSDKLISKMGRHAIRQMKRIEGYEKIQKNIFQIGHAPTALHEMSDYAYSRQVIAPYGLKRNKMGQILRKLRMLLRNR